MGPPFNFKWDSFAEVDYASARYARAVAHEVGLDARRLCPVDTGLLRSTIDVRPDGNNPKRVNVKVATHYWRYQEFGTSRMKAQPFLRPALRRRRNVRYLLDDPSLPPEAVHASRKPSGTGRRSNGYARKNTSGLRRRRRRR